jgi:Cu-processing system permease protein
MSSMPLIRSLARMTLLEAVRNRLVWLAVVVIGSALGLSGFLSQVALIESIEIETTLMAAILRTAAVFIVATFVITSMVREASDKVNELALSQAAPRAAYFFGRFAGFAMVAATLALLFALPLMLLAPLPHVAFWAMSLVCELVIVIAVSLFCVVSLTHVLTAFSATMGFYLLSRSMAAMQVIASFSPGTHPWVDRLIGDIVNAVAIILPSLDRMTQTSWLLNGAPLPIVVAGIIFQTLLYVTLICSATLFDLYRKSY